MEEYQETACANMDVVAVVDAKQSTPPPAKRPTPPPTTSTVQREGGGHAANEVTQKVFATEEQFRSVFSNALVSWKPQLIKLICRILECSHVA